MRRYLYYLLYIIRHKWFVFLQCYKFGISWLGVIHDWSKFLPSEFIPYARHFHDLDGSPKQIRNETGYYKPTNTGDAAFDFAWFLHQKRNRHHWQWWVFPENNSGVRVFQIPRKYRLEMLADWLGAGRAQNTPDVVRWYIENRDKMIFHLSTREWIENELRRDVYAKCESNGRMKLVGWIRAKRSDKRRLRNTFHVGGKMIYNWTNGCFEYCTLDSMEAIEKLRREFPGFYAGAFTAIDGDDNQLPRDEQPCWGMEDCAVHITIDTAPDEGISSYTDSDPLLVELYREESWRIRATYFVDDMLWRIRAALRVLLYGEVD